jgi:hypothetical protein
MCIVQSTHFTVEPSKMFSVEITCSGESVPALVSAEVGELTFGFIILKAFALLHFFPEKKNLASMIN